MDDVRNPILSIILCCAFLLMGCFTFANNTDSVADPEEKDIKTEIEDYIQHHLKDSHDFSLFSYTDDEGIKHHIGLPLPVILWDNG